MQDMTSAIDRVLEEPVTSGALPGVVGLAANDEGFFYQGAFGRRRVEVADPMTLDTVFRIASMTKAITATAAMQLVEAGRIRLEQPMAEIAPEIGQVQVLEGFDANGQPRLRAPKRPVTLRHLLTHTSGYSYDIFNADLGRYIEAAGLPSVLTRKLVSLRAPLVFDPGERWEYGIGIDWVGRIVEIVSGRDLEAYFQEYIFRPLGMNDSSFHLNASMEKRLVGTHARQPDGKVAPTTFEFPEGGEFLMGGGGLYSTAPDYLAYTRMMLNRGELNGVRVLKPETVALMGQNHIGAIEVPMLKSANPALAREVDFFPGMVKKWGLSFLINTEEAPTGRAAGTLAWAGIHNTFFWIDPTKRVAAVLMMQLLPANDEAVLTTLAGFEQAIYQGLKR
jgi:methyl acetate hydrolase